MPNHNFSEILSELQILHDLKNKDYGTDHDPYQNVRSSQEWGVAPWMGAMIRLNDKIRRLQKYAKDGTLANESAEDSFRDIAVYAVIALDLWRQEQVKPARQQGSYNGRCGIGEGFVGLGVEREYSRVD